MFMDYEKGQSYRLLQNLVGVSINLNDVAAARKYFEQSRATRPVASSTSR